MHKQVVLCLVLWFLETFGQVEVFQGGEGGYFCFRVPDLLVTSKGTVLAFAEARNITCADHGWVDLVVKRSYDGGQTWSALSVVYANSTVASHVTIGNAAPVQDSTTNRILVPFCTNNLNLWITYSDDDGLTWAAPAPIPNITDPKWGWFATGPPGGLELASGRIVIPSYYSFKYFMENMDSHVFLLYSDDHGSTWYAGNSSTGSYNPNESQAVELEPGTILINSRTNNGGSQMQHRYQTLSTDNGNSLEGTYPASGLQTPSCAGTIIKHSTTGLLYYAGASSISSRTNMTVFTSDDQGENWTYLRQIDPKFSAYCALAELPNGTVVLLYETDNYLSQTFVVVQ